MPLECDDFAFRKVNWLLPLRRGRWLGFRLTAKLPLSKTKPNCWRSLRSTFYTENTLIKVFCEPKDFETVGDSKKIIYQFYCGKSETVYFSEPLNFKNWLIYLAVLYNFLSRRSPTSTLFQWVRIFSINKRDIIIYIAW